VGSSRRVIPVLVSRAATLVVSGLPQIAAAALALNFLGPRRYAVVAVMTVIPAAAMALSSISGTTLVNAAAAGDDAQLRRAIGGSLRTAVVSGCALLAGGLALSATHMWGRMLGLGADEASLDSAMVGILTITAAYLVLSTANRVLVALEKAPMATWSQAPVGPVTFGLTLLFEHLGLSAVWFAYALPSGLLVGALVATCLTLCVAPRSVLPSMWLIRRRHGAATQGGARVTVLSLLTQLPFDIVLLGGQLGLSHVAGPGDVSTYAVLLQFYRPLQSLLGLSAQALWVSYARRRDALTARYVVRHVSGFCFAGMTLGLASCVLLAISSHLFHTVFSVQLGVALIMFSGMQGARLPLSYLLADARGLRVTAALSVLTASTFLGVIVPTARLFGVVAVPASGSVTLCALYVLPLTYHILTTRLIGSTIQTSGAAEVARASSS
jgi:hypothetical protein